MALFYLRVDALMLSVAALGAVEIPQWHEPHQNSVVPPASSEFWLPVPGAPNSTAVVGQFVLHDAPQKLRTWHCALGHGNSQEYDGLSEKAVFFREIEHLSDQGSGWQIRLGKGSQVYSLLQEGREWMGAQSAANRWVDRVIQSVTVVPESIHSPDFKVVMMHQAGITLTPALAARYDVPCFQPLLAYEFRDRDANDLCFDTVSHLFITQTEDHGRERPWNWQPKAMLWQRLRDLGDGVIERTAIIYNYGNTDLGNFTDMWAGLVSYEPTWEDDIFHPLREENMSRRIIPIISQAGGGGWWPAGFSKLKTVGTDRTEGWVALCVESARGTAHVDDASAGLGYVFGTGDLPGVSSTIAYGGNTNQHDLGEVNMRQNLTVLATNRRLVQKPGDLWYARHFFIFGNLAHIRENAHRLMISAACGRLSPYTITPSDRQAGLVPLAAAGNEVPAPDVSLWNKPVIGGTPIFLMREDQSGDYFCTNDPYIVSPRVAEGHAVLIRLCGFGVQVAADEFPPAGLTPLSRALTDPRQCRLDAGIEVYVQVHPKR
jgi:hypothetical protein